MTVIEKIARAMCEVQRYAATENELARAIDEVPGFLADLRRHGLVVVPVEPTDEMVVVGIHTAIKCTENWTAAGSCVAEHVWQSMLSAAAQIEG